MLEHILPIYENIKEYSFEHIKGHKKKEYIKHISKNILAHPIYLLSEVGVAPLHVARATSAATFFCSGSAATF